MRKLLSALLASAVLSQPALADCWAWDRPRTEESGIVKRLNSYTEGSRVCIPAATQYCDYCTAGFFHECKHNKWEVERAFPCKGTEGAKAPADPLKDGLNAGQSKAKKDGPAPESGSGAAANADCLALKNPEKSRQLQDSDPTRWLELNERCS